MEMLRIEVAYEDGKGKGKAIAEVPFINGKVEDLPKIHPFTQNIYLTGDDGFSLGFFGINTIKRTIVFGYDAKVALVEAGHAQYKMELRSGTYEYDFRLI